MGVTWKEILFDWNRSHTDKLFLMKSQTGNIFVSHIFIVVVVGYLFVCLFFAFTILKNEVKNQS